MMRLQLVYRAVLTRYNFETAFMNHTKEQDNEFDEAELIKFVEWCDYMDGDGGYRTEIHIEKLYKVVREWDAQ